MMAYDEIISEIRRLYPLCFSKEYLSLALCGEAGELANKIKKAWGGYEDIPLEEIKLELADVANYVHHLMLTLEMSQEELANLQLQKAEKFLRKLTKHWPEKED
jgi:NTP pyrophosphatase (non-canonical NTP hydrolase)